MKVEQMSLIEVAENLMLKKKKPQKFAILAKEAGEMKGLNDLKDPDILASFYTDLITSSKFVYCGEETFDLKNRQVIDLYSKDASYFNEGQNEIEQLEKELEKLTPKEKKEVVKVEKVVQKEVKSDGLEDVKYIEDIISNETESTVEADSATELDEDKYNEIMDDYEDIYDE